MSILVTGPDGVLGSNLVRELLSREKDVHVLLEPGKDPVTLQGLPITKHHGNILDKDQLDSLIQGKKVVFHCAASTSMFPARNETVNKVNIQGTQHVIESCLKHKVERMIYVGTANSFHYGTSLEQLGKEDTNYGSARYGLDYMDSKYKAQQLVLQAVKEQHLPAIIVNPTFMIGPFDSRPSSGEMILAIYHRKIPGYTKGGKNYVAVKDVAFAMANAIEMGRVGECYILGNANLSYKEAFDKIAAAIGGKAPTIGLPNFIIKRYGALNSFFARIFGYYPGLTRELAVISCDNHFYSSQKAIEELQMPQTPIDVAVKECFEWFKQHGYLTKK